ncbi:hypothetical protein C8R45DRAFT_1131393 [Mycena sanguinolenta]|nr:hypothetical protein C8R45DRAFT_1131393 [Mycena sanguinolenta]
MHDPCIDLSYVSPLVLLSLLGIDSLCTTAITRMPSRPLHPPDARGAVTRVPERRAVGERVGGRACLHLRRADGAGNTNPIASVVYPSSFPPPSFQRRTSLSSAAPAPAPSSAAPFFALARMTEAPRIERALHYHERTRLHPQHGSDALCIRERREDARTAASSTATATTPPRALLHRRAATRIRRRSTTLANAVTKLRWDTAMTDRSALRIARRSWAPKTNTCIYMCHDLHVDLPCVSPSSCSAHDARPPTPSTRRRTPAQAAARRLQANPTAHRAPTAPQAIPPAHARAQYRVRWVVRGGSCVVVELDAAEEKYGAPSYASAGASMALRSSRSPSSAPRPHEDEDDVGGGV